MTTIGLCMIVKNESKVITRCLDSVRPLVDYVMIEDTGSTDGTQQLITGWLERAAMPGMVIEEPWRDFAYNRSHVLVKLRELEQIDYALIIDADDLLVLPKDFDPAAFKAGMRDDLYDVQIRHGGSRFYRPQICANKLPFCFKAVLHEYLEAPAGPLSRSSAEGFYIETGRGGARNENPTKYQDDAAMLAKALLTETEPFLISRYTFYVAQSYRDCGEREKALAYYLKRADLGFWAEEVFESLYEAAKLQEALGFSVEQVIATYLRATEAAPTRAEALHGAARFCRSKGRNEEGYQYAKRGCDIPVPAGGLFVESWVYAYGLLDELAINGYWSGHHREALDACLRLLASSALPADQRERVGQNARFSLEKLPGDRDRDLGSLGQSNLVDQHALVAERPLRSRVFGTPRVMVAILAKQKERMLPLYLECIEALDYPKSSIVLYVRTNNNTDGTERILREWVERVGHLYAAVEFVADDVAEPVQQFGAHEWNAMRFRVLGRIRNISLSRAVEHKCDFYFVADADNFIRPCTLRELLAVDFPIVSPLLRSIEAGQFYSNYHAEVDANGYYKNCDQYQWILNRWVRGVIEVPVVHTTYLIRADMIPALNYEDATDRHEYVVFSDSARQAGAVQYLDNRQVYGYIAFGEDSPQYVVGGVERARSLLSGGQGVQGGLNPFAPTPPTGAGSVPGISQNVRPGKPRVFGCFGQHGSGSTWMFNLVREICLAEGVDFVSVHRDSKANLPWDAPGSPLIVAKSQNPMADLESYIVDSGEPAVITVRDPRDAVVSFMQRFPNSLATSFEEALKAIAWSGERLVALSRLRKLPVFRYEDKFIGSVETFDRIAAMLRVIPSATHRAEILAALEPEAVKKKIGRLEAAGSIRGEAIWDRETHWHANHVGDGKVGKFRDNLSVAQENEILRQTREYCDHFGYDMTASSRGVLNSGLDGGRVAAPCGASLSDPQPANHHSGSEPGEEAHIREKFSQIYQRNEWGYGSGVGSLASNNISYMEFIQSFIESHGVKSVVDFGCGDWQFSRLINWSDADYVGLDLVPHLIETNRKNFARSGVSFEIFRSLDDVPDADLLICKDVFQHLSNETIAKYLAIFKQRFRFLLITNDDQPETLVNGEIEAGGWRPVRLDRPPFAERAPILLSWTVTEGGWIPTHKAACLINGNSSGEFLHPTTEFATSGDNQARQAPGDRDSRRVSGGVQQVALADDPAHSHCGISPGTHIGGWGTELECDAVGQPLTGDPASGYVEASAVSDGCSLANTADAISALTNCGTMEFPDEARSERRRQLDERPAVQLRLPPGFVPSASPVPGEEQSATAQHHHSQIAASGWAAGAEPEVEFQSPVRNGLKTDKGKTNELPCIHLINLDRSPERLLRFRDYNSHLKGVVRVSATDGATVDREALVSSGYINRDLPYSDGTLGCAVSHMRLWEMAASQDRNVTIFEDDIIVSHQFEKRAQEVLKVLPNDWDIIKWGYCFNPLYLWIDLGISKARLERYGAKGYRGVEGHQEFQAEEFIPAPVKLLHSFGLQGYSISAKGARAALNHCLPLRN